MPPHIRDNAKRARHVTAVLNFEYWACSADGRIGLRRERFGRERLGDRRFGNVAEYTSDTRQTGEAAAVSLDATAGKVDTARWLLSSDFGHQPADTTFGAQRHCARVDDDISCPVEIRCDMPSASAQILFDFDSFGLVDLAAEVENDEGRVHECYLGELAVAC